MFRFRMVEKWHDPSPAVDNNNNNNNKPLSVHDMTYWRIRVRQRHKTQIIHRFSSWHHYRRYYCYTQKWTRHLHIKIIFRRKWNFQVAVRPCNASVNKQTWGVFAFTKRYNNIYLALVTALYDYTSYNISYNGTVYIYNTVITCIQNGRGPHAPGRRAAIRSRTIL